MKSSSTMTITLVEKLLNRERENTREWLRGSMDTLIDELFHKLKTELISSLVFNIEEEDVLKSRNSLSNSQIKPEPMDGSNVAILKEQSRVLEAESDPTIKSELSRINENAFENILIPEMQLVVDKLEGDDEDEDEEVEDNGKINDPENDGTDCDCLDCVNEDALDQQIDDPPEELDKEEVGINHNPTNLIVSNKRKFSPVTPIRPKQARLSRHICTDCSKVFKQYAHLKAHQRIHLGVKPYKCSLCGYRSEQQSPVVTHIRRVHFGLPKTMKKQREQNIVDNRDPNQYLEVDEELLENVNT